MHSEHPPKHHILHIFNAFIFFYYPSFLSTYPPPSLMVTPSIARDDTLTFAATRWVFVAWRAQIERKYNPQGGSIHLISSTRGSLLSSATPGYRKYNPDGVAPLPTIYYHIITRRVPMPQHGIARRSHLFLALLGGKLDVAGVVFQNFLAQGCRVDVRVNLCG